MIRTALILVEVETHGVGARIRAARLGAGLTQKQLAEALGVESITVSRWERGVTSPSLPRLQRIAEVASTALTDLVQIEGSAPAAAAELAALREELAETRALVDRVARTLERLTQQHSPGGSRPA